MFHASRLFAIARRAATFSRASVMYHSVMFSSTPNGTEEESVCHVQVVFILGYKETMPFFNIPPWHVLGHQWWVGGAEALCISLLLTPSWKVHPNSSQEPV